ncbi:MAG: hypothetical protein GY862_29590, partial [Gammaproteobacteria bacterium]|nr:hypothetical protein [Gammaproteobacteria bacterium]
KKIHSHAGAWERAKQAALEYAGQAVAADEKIEYGHEYGHGYEYEYGWIYGEVIFFSRFVRNEGKIQFAAVYNQ